MATSVLVPSSSRTKGAYREGGSKAAARASLLGRPNPTLGRMCRSSGTYASFPSP